MNILREAIHRTSLKYNGFVPDFIIPAVGGDPDQPVLLAPLTRAQGILLLRKFLLTSSPSMDVSHIGVHSCKVTFLSWSRQLGIDEELRRHQGHHRSSGGNQCVDLYGRDDVFPALTLQRVILSKVAAGFRPLTPVLRGAGTAISDRPVTVPPLLADPCLEVQTSIQLPATEELVDTDSNVSEDDEHNAASESPISSDWQMIDAADCVFLLNDVSRVAHFAAECEPSDPQRVCTYMWQGTSRSFKFSCGARRAVGDTSISPSESIPPDYRLCLRPACPKMLD